MRVFFFLAALLAVSDAELNKACTDNIALLTGLEEAYDALAQYTNTTCVDGDTSNSNFAFLMNVIFDVVQNLASNSVLYNQAYKQALKSAEEKLQRPGFENAAISLHVIDRIRAVIGQRAALLSKLCCQPDAQEDLCLLALEFHDNLIEEQCSDYKLSVRLHVDALNVAVRFQKSVESLLDASSSMSPDLLIDFLKTNMDSFQDVLVGSEVGYVNVLKKSYPCVRPLFELLSLDTPDLAS